MNRFDQLLVRHLRTDDNAKQMAARVSAALGEKPLPRQRHSRLSGWPSALLNSEFAPAWPRLAALAAVALVGCGIGFFGPGTPVFQRTGWSNALAQNADSDVGGVAFDPEPLTGAKP
jgi:hypothetical protein